jgi:hypothetical protein
VGSVIAARLSIVVAVASLLAVASASAAGEGRVVPQRGIAGLRLGMTQARVKATVGLPRRVEHGRNEIGTYTTYEYRTYSVTFFGGPRATGFETRSPRERTLRGVGVGSTRADVAAHVDSARCVRESGYDHCYVGRWLPGGTVTDFTLVKGRVTRIFVGYVID